VKDDRGHDPIQTQQDGAFGKDDSRGPLQLDLMFSFRPKEQQDRNASYRTQRCRSKECFRLEGMRRKNEKSYRSSDVDGDTGNVKKNRKWRPER